MMTKRTCGQSGFTVMELLTVISIISIMITVGGYYYNEFRNRYNAESQMREMFVTLMNTRVRAMSRNRAHFVSLAPTQYAVYEDTSPGPDGNGTLETSADTRVEQKGLRELYKVTWDNGSQVKFDARGLVTAGTGTVWVQERYGPEYDCIVIEQTRINMGAYNAGTCAQK